MANWFKNLFKKKISNEERKRNIIIKIQNLLDQAKNQGKFDLKEKLKEFLTLVASSGYVITDEDEKRLNKFTAELNSDIEIQSENHMVNKVNVMENKMFNKNNYISEYNDDLDKLERNVGKKQIDITELKNQINQLTRQQCALDSRIELLDEYDPIQALKREELMEEYQNLGNDISRLKRKLNTVSKQKKLAQSTKRKVEDNISVKEISSYTNEVSNVAQEYSNEEAEELIKEAMDKTQQIEQEAKEASSILDKYANMDDEQEMTPQEYYAMQKAKQKNPQKDFAAQNTKKPVSSNNKQVEKSNDK